MSKTILGLDLGTNSIGWALVEINHEKGIVKIIGLGSRILPMSTMEISDFENNGTIKSTASQRTEKRGPRRLNERFLLRRDRLHLVLNLLNALPEHYKIEVDFERNGVKSGKFKANKEPKIAYIQREDNPKKYDFLFNDAYNEMLNDFEIKNIKGKRVPYDWTLYYLRKKAIDGGKLSLEEFAWVLLSYNQKRGYEKTEVIEKSVKENEIIEAAEAKFIRLDGSIIDVEISAVSVNFEGEEALHVVLRNITNEKIMREMVANHARFPGENPNPVLRIDANGTLIYANTKSQALLHKWQCSLGEEIPPQWKEQIKQSLRRSQVVQVEEAVGNRVYTLALTPIQDAQYVNIYASDITERKQAEKDLRAERANLGLRVEESTQELRLANEELARNARLKDEFMASMSHELRTPLNAILGMSEALQEQIFGPLNDKQRHYLETIEESGYHLLSLINDILDISKIEAGEMHLMQDTIHVEDICRSSLAFISESAAEKHLKINRSLQENIPPFTADSLRMKQILINLLSNAVKFTPEGGSIGIEAMVNEERSLLKFVVWDTGIGIANKDTSRLFKPFVQLDSSLSRQYNGTGLGLALVYSLTKLHGGGITMESEPGQGTRFTITLPLLSPTSQNGEPKRAILLAAPATIQQAMLVDNTPDEAVHTTRLLEELGVKVSSFYSGKHVMQKALDLKPDVIIMGLLLPETSGWTVLEQLQNDPRTQHIPIILVTVVEDHKRAMDLGVIAHLVKPIHRYELFECLQKAAEQKDNSDLAIDDNPSNETKTILLAEDNESNIETIADFLKINGYQIRIARNGLDALDSINLARPDLILMDIQMPGLDGVETIQRIRENPLIEQMPIIALTALAMPGDQERCLNAGANKYMSKPVQLKELLNTITSLL